jgi:uncharacterized protein YecE (DUF72 family)
LVQFPASFRAGDAGWRRLARIRALLPRDRLVAELRHRSWFDDVAYRRLADLGFGLAHIDLPAARDHPPEEHPSLGDLAYLRLHGRNAGTWFDPKAGRDDRYDYRYDAPEVEALAGRLEQLASRSEKALLVANNHFGGQAVAAALEIRAAVTGERPRAPRTFVDAFPDLAGRLDLHDPDGQGQLF